MIQSALRGCWLKDHYFHCCHRLKPAHDPELDKWNLVSGLQMITFFHYMITQRNAKVKTKLLQCHSHQLWFSRQNRSSSTWKVQSLTWCETGLTKELICKGKNMTLPLHKYKHSLQMISYIGIYFKTVTEHFLQILKCNNLLTLKGLCCISNIFPSVLTSCEFY